MESLGAPFIGIQLISPVVGEAESESPEFDFGAGRSGMGSDWGLRLCCLLVWVAGKDEQAESMRHG